MECPRCKSENVSSWTHVEPGKWKCFQPHCGAIFDRDAQARRLGVLGPKSTITGY